MLTEIRCSAFEDCGKARGPIVFNPGLNVVLGSSHGSNSIGKSTFLLIVDFAFGGETYAKNKETLQNVGPHTIDFAFEFDGVTHRFSRSPMDVERVWRCDEDYNHVEEISLRDFCEWLSGSYGMSGLGGTFRGLVSVFMRAYGKENYNVVKPLQSVPREQEEAAVTRLLRLYGRYGMVDQAWKLLKEAEEDKKAFDASMKHDYIAVARNKSECKQNEKRLAVLDERKEQRAILESKLAPLDAQIENLEGDIKRAGTSSNLTKQILDEFYSVSRERDKLREANAGFDKREQLVRRVKSLKEQKDTAIGAALSSTQAEVNARLAELNDYVCGEGKSTPAISLTKSNSYSFGIPNDSGTGSQTRAMVLFDIVVLEQTPLPAICHDTVSLKQIADEPMMKLVDLYHASGKQVFITLDKAESYADGKVPETINRAVVLELSDGHKLFGRSWATKGDDEDEG